MKKLKLTKVIASSLVVASVLALKPIGASAEWKRDSSYRWLYTEGNSYATGWRNINGSWYYFDSDAHMVTSTVIDKYYVNKNGVWVDDSIYNVTAIKAQEIVKQHFTNGGMNIPPLVKVEGEGQYGNSWNVHCYNITGSNNAHIATYGWFFVDKTTGKFLSR